MAVNLSRNTKVFITTTADNASTFTTADTFLIDVLNGYSFNQQADAQSIQLSEAGTAPVRGSRSFNVKLNPVDWKFSTYVRPYLSTNHSAVEKYLWQYMADDRNVDTTGVSVTTVSASSTTTGAIVTVTAPTHGFTTGANSPDIGRAVSLVGVSDAIYNTTWTIATVPTTNTLTFVYTGLATITAAPTLTSGKIYKSAWHETTSYARMNFAGSNRNSLASFGLIFLVDNTCYRVNSCAVDGANINFDLQGIATIDWNGFGTTLAQITPTWTGGIATFVTNAAATKFITNKLSTTVFKSGLEGAGVAGGGANGTAYTVPITGGSISIKNNIQYVTPETLGKVNTAIGYFTGSRQVTGSLQAYLKTGTNETAQLLSDVLTNVGTTTEPKFYVEIDIGGATNTVARVNMKLPAVTLTVPSVEVQDVMSTTINFTAQSYNGAGFDLAFANELQVSYYGS